MAFLFDTDAISELLRPRPATAYIKWIMAISREEQFTSAVVIGELYQGAYRSRASERHTVLPYDIGTAKIFGRIRAHLEKTGAVLPDADIQIAATALNHGLELVAGNLRHFSRIAGLKLNTILADSRLIQ
jgi:predicted nucleic acid-binding protein